MSHELGARRVVGMAVYGDVTHDSRIRREAVTLARAGFEVRLVCLASSGMDGDLGDGVTVLVRTPAQSAALPGALNPFWANGRKDATAILARLRWLRAYSSGLRSWGQLAAAAVGPVGVWHLHDLPGLFAVGPLVPRHVPIVYDAHELFLEAGTAARLPRLLRRLLGAYEERLASRAAAVVTVNDELASVLRDRLPGRRIIVVHNCPERWTPPPIPTDRLRAAAGVASGTPVILHHGALGATRGIEQLIGVLREPGLERAHLVLMGPGHVRVRYVEMADASELGDRIHVLDPVPPSELLDWIATADVGAMPIQRTTLNHYLSTPNKLFECLATGVPVVVSDFPAMRRIVLDDPAGQLGAVCNPASIGSIAAALRSILDREPDEAAELRARCLAAASRRWNWYSQSEGLLTLYSQLADRLAASRGRGETRLPQVELEVARRPETGNRRPR